MRRKTRFCSGLRDFPTSSYHCILYTQGKCLHRHLFPARIFKDMKCCGNSFCVIHQVMLNVAIFMLIPATFYFIASLEQCFIYVIVSKAMFKLCYCFPELYLIVCQVRCFIYFIGRCFSIMANILYILMFLIM